MLNTNRVIQRYKLDSRFAKEIDKGILISMLLLIMFGILNIYLCTKGEVFPVLGPFYFTKRQIIWFLISMVALYIILTVDYRVIYNYIPIIYWASVILLLMVWIP
ncbi:MAG: FtsW/RodA/SpoVE family cell cycle protein, partial [Clostridium sp.]|nr:FtsW/RodA/SpoVE family cell cycle protein [Clostridium sp.]